MTQVAVPRRTFEALTRVGEAANRYEAERAEDREKRARTMLVEVGIKAEQVDYGAKLFGKSPESFKPWLDTQGMSAERAAAIADAANERAFDRVGLVMAEIEAEATAIKTRHSEMSESAARMKVLASDAGLRARYADVVGDVE